MLYLLGAIWSNNRKGLFVSWCCKMKGGPTIQKLTLCFTEACKSPCHSKSQSGGDILLCWDEHAGSLNDSLTLFWSRWSEASGVNEACGSCGQGGGSGGSAGGSDLSYPSRKGRSLPAAHREGMLVLVMSIQTFVHTFLFSAILACVKCGEKKLYIRWGSYKQLERAEEVWGDLILCCYYYFAV